MQGDLTEKTKSIGEMKKRRVKMADEKRYLIYYTFGDGSASPLESEEKLPETNAQNSAVEEEDIDV